MTDAPSIIEAIDSEELFAPWFRGKSWAAWRTVLKTLFALPLSEDEIEIFMAATGRIVPPGAAFSQAWLCIGRRGGKSLASALIAVYLAVFRDYGAYLARGEMATVMLVAADKKQARVVLRFIRAFIREVPMLASLVVRQTVDAIELANRVVIEVHTASFRTVRGYTLAASINDELAFWQSDENSAEPDREILAAQRPALATIPGALQLNISSPYARRGSLFAAYEKHYGNDASNVLFWKAASRAPLEDESVPEMNPTIDRALVREAYVADPIAAAAEWGANFRSDVEQVFTQEMLDRVTDYARPQILPPSFEEEAA